MKIRWFIALAIVAMAMLGCPSEPEKPGKKLKEGEYDFVINGGNYAVTIPTDGDGGFTITDGEKYRALFIVSAADDDFYGSRVGGKLVYDDGGAKDKVLAGWTWLNPPFIKGPGTYFWTFTAGDKGKDGEGETLVSPATTPAGATQKFTMNVQTPDYKQYASYFEFRIKGSIIVTHRVQPSGTLASPVTIALAFNDSSHDSAIGKGNIEGSEFEKVKAASGNQAYLRFYITNAKVTAQAGEEGHGVGAVGNKENSGDDNLNYPLNIPRGTSVNNSASFEIDVEIEDILNYFVGANESHIFVNMWGDGPAKCSKVELYEYK